MLGNLLANRYRIEAELGQGGMDMIYRAHDTLLNRGCWELWNPISSFVGPPNALIMTALWL